jgi:hypothetical protein
MILGRPPHQSRYASSPPKAVALQFQTTGLSLMLTINTAGTWCHPVVSRLGGKGIARRWGGFEDSWPRGRIARRKHFDMAKRT